MRSILCAVLLLCMPTLAQAQTSTFSQDVNRAIDLGLQYLDGQGVFTNNSAAGDAAGLCALALLERRESDDVNAQAAGYENATPQDQNRIENIIGYLLGRANAGYYAYRDGGDLMAMSVYLRTGGPRQAEAQAAVAAIFEHADERSYMHHAASRRHQRGDSNKRCAQ